MPNLTYKNDSESDERLNPAELAAREHSGNTGADDQQAAFDRDFEDMMNPDNYNRDGNEGELANANQKAVADAESNPDNINYTGTGAKSGKQKLDIKGVLKKKAPVGGIIGLLLGGAGILSFFGGPGLLLVHISEVLTEKFNFQLASMDDRTTKILTAKFKNTTTGVCTSVVTFRCKLASFSDNEVKNFKAAGIEMVDNKTTILGRTQPSKLKFEGKEISASEFSKELKSNYKFAVAVKNGYPVKFAGMSDDKWKKVATKLGISKAAPFKGEKTDEARQKRLQDISQNGQDTSKAPTPNDCDNKECTAEEKKAADEKQKAAKSANEIGKSAEDVVKDKIRKSTGVIGGVTKAIKAGKNAVSVAGAVDDGCSTFGMLNLVSVGLKTIVAVQMIRYSMAFHTETSMIKSGDAQSEDVNYLSNILTKIVKNSDGTTTKAATDSFGWRNAAYGDTGMDDAAMPYMAGGGLGGDFAVAAGVLLKIIGVGDAKRGREVCKINSNIAVQIGTFVAGIALWIVPGGQAIQGSKVAAQAAIGITVAVATAILPSLLIDIASGQLVDKNTFGEASGNILASGTGSLLSAVSAGGGNGALTPEDAVAYQQMTDSVIAKYSDLEGKNQFDASNPHTFMGSIYSNLLPYASSFSSLSGILTSSTSIVGSTVANITSPRTKALTADDYKKCPDYDIKENNIAANEMCVIIRGIPPKYLSKEKVPEKAVQEVQDRLVASKDVDEDSGEPISGDYQNLIATCMDRTAEEVDTEICVIKDQHTADMFIHYIDLRVMKGLETYGTDSYGGLNVMTYNILGTEAGKKEGSDISWKTRIKDVVSTVLTADADIIGFQEVTLTGTPDQFSELSGQLKTKYSSYPAGADDGAQRAIFWKKSDFTLLDSDMYTYPRYETNDTKMPWVKLQHTSGKTFYVFNTHLAAGDSSWRPKTDDGKLTSPQARTVETKKFLDAIKRTVTDGSPVILTGDFNSTCEVGGNDDGLSLEDIPCQMLKTGKAPGEDKTYPITFADTGETAAIKTNFEYNTTHGSAGGSFTKKENGKEGRHIDHVFFNAGSGITVNTWETIINDTTKRASDHTPVIANLNIPGMFQNQPSNNSIQTGSDIDGDDYKTECKKYAFCTGQCVDFVLFRLVKHGVKLTTHTLGNGRYVVGTLGKMGYKVDTTPAVHSVMSTSHTSQPQYGHTAMVSRVNSDGSILVEEYNYANPKHYSTRTITASEIKAKEITFAHTEVDYK